MVTAIIGLQWGDEGKGKVVDFLASNFQAVVRYQGGHNAGHTVYYNGQKFIFHLLPSGVFCNQSTCIISGGVVVNPLKLLEELEQLAAIDLKIENFYLSEDAPLILPFHQQLDIVFEESRYSKIGTTRRGIGPAYEDLYGRRAIFIRDLKDEKQFRSKVEILLGYYNQIFKSFAARQMKLEEFIDDYLSAGSKLNEYIADTRKVIANLLERGKRILMEGAQGFLLDITFGTYPFVTSSHPGVAGIFTATGINHKELTRVIGISKAYTTRVGEGPFPTELSDDFGKRLRDLGAEYGSTTGRPRRVGWLDLVALKYAVRINGVDEIFITKLDVLDQLEEIPLAIGYQLKRERFSDFSPAVEFLEQVKPVYKKFKGWQKSLKNVRKVNDLPVEALKYLNFIAEFLETKIRYVSVGTEREETIVID